MIVYVVQVAENHVGIFTDSIWSTKPLASSRASTLEREEGCDAFITTYEIDGGETL